MVTLALQAHGLVRYAEYSKTTPCKLIAKYWPEPPIQTVTGNVISLLTSRSRAPKQVPASGQRGHQKQLIGCFRNAGLSLPRSRSTIMTSGLRLMDMPSPLDATIHTGAFCVGLSIPRSP